MKAIQNLHYKTVKENLLKNKLAFAENERTLLQKKKILCRKINTLTETTRLWGDPLKWTHLTVKPRISHKFRSEVILASYRFPSPFLCKKNELSTYLNSDPF